MCSQGFLPGFLEGNQPIFERGKESLSQRGICLGFISEHQIEWRCSSGVMWGRVVLKLCSGKEVKPRFRTVGTKYAEVCFYFLVGTFSLSIGLWVVGGGEFDVILKESCQFTGKG